VRALVRWSIVIGAATVAAWFVINWVQARDIGRAQELISASRLPPSAARQAASLLDSAGELSPDRDVDILRAQLADDEGQAGRGVRIMQQVTAAEPLNLEAWRELGVVATHNHQRHLAQVAFTHVLYLLGYRH
jgi:hypothetical protein